MKRPSIVGIILAGGSGQRMGGTFKQFLRIKGRPLLFYSLETFIRSKFLKQIIIVVPKKKFRYANALIRRNFNDSRIQFVIGGENRRLSMFHALSFLEKQIRQGEVIDYVMSHDAARPLITLKDMKKLASAMVRWGGATAGIRALDLPIKVQKGFFVDSLDKHEIYYDYTPQCFRFRELYTAHLQANTLKGLDKAADNLEILKATRSPLNIKIVETYPNFKVTYKSDFSMLAGYLRENK